ncbi:AAA family ATPase [Marinobacterium sedimentorum]|uniref:AAA family ATPase n=1 Tax=Marinobacterium sedimentorum TaxID=2927804 RepID=UPI0020C5DFE0|nr:AAA family ATPase [Marinobacterium sedimentorum]MCP8685951.1 AAA family ATPase [Marinobacterium sedimentorum]
MSKNITPKEAWEMAKKSSENPEHKKDGVMAYGTSLEDMSLLYHAATSFNLTITTVKLNGQNIEITDDIKKLKFQDWNEFKSHKMMQTADTKLIRFPSIRELNSLIGLKKVKKQINDITDFQKVQKARKKAGLPVITMGQHLVFTGNPGTGKTTVARIVGDIYRELGLLEKGHFVEIGGRDLTGQYLGETNVKAKKIIESAIDGVLFIDEAYSLCDSNSYKDYGAEAIAALIKYMEDYRDRLVVIVAGYDKEMEALLNSNPGLKSRFKNKIEFQDYNSEELCAMFRFFCEKEAYLLEPETDKQLRQLCQHIDANKNEQFGNGRTIRNVFEAALMNQARRLVAAGKRPDKQKLQTFSAADIPAPEEFDW